ncbi:hypothetical protein M2447_002792 [Ereboglobus sp. PH5-10]|uniref:hypothetical protein n=1 Tax=Ereboglobus sp. PH5-10 TaxID=2940629 RepID=UPI002405AD87|nr:hypothetical protein [Ereboglobus sp. PH5-10]MDF9828664.1 hypothetical protein [Ereboglobus sp. PH5-10]
MAVKLTTNNKMPSAVSALELRSAGNVPSIQLQAEDVREQVDNQWVTSTVKKKQLITFIGADGSPCALEGTVAESEAVEIEAAYKIVVQIKVANELKAAFQAGRVSRAYTSLEVVRVTEVWDSPKNCLWKAKDDVPAGTSVNTMDESGRIIRKAA